MQGNTFTLPVIVPGTLAADVTAHFKHMRELQLVGISAKTDDTTSFILKIGTAADDDKYYTGTVTGGAMPVLLDDDDFVEAGSPLPWSKEYLVTVDYDGGAGGNAANVTVVLYLSE